MSDDNVLWSLDGDAAGAMGALDEIDGGLQALQEQLDALAGNLESFTALQEELTASADASAGLDEALSGLMEAMSAASAAAQEAAASLGEEGGAADAAAGSLDGLGTSAEGAAAGLDATAASADAEAGSMAAAGDVSEAAASKFAMVGIALGAAGIGMLVLGGQAQDSLTTVAALTGASQAQMTQYTAGLEQMSTQMGVSMKGAADGLYYVASAGFTGTDAMNVLKIAMEAAKAGGTDVKTTADALTSALNAYGASASQASQYSDIMVEAVTQGKQTFQDFASAVGMAAVTGHTAGFSFSEVSAAEATMTQSGLTAHRAVMQLDFMMRSIGLSTQTVADHARKLGISFDIAHYSSLGLIGKLQYLQTLAHGNKAAFEKLVGGANGLSAAEILLGKHGATYNGILDKMKNSSGATAQAFAISEKTMSAHLSKLGGAFTVLAYNIATMATPVVTAVFDGLSHALGMFLTFLTQHGPLAKVILTGLAIVLGGILVQALWSFIEPMAIATIEMLPFIAGMVLAVGALVLLGIGLHAAWTHFKPLRDAVHHVATVFGDLFSGVHKVMEPFDRLETVTVKVGNHFRTVHRWVSGTRTVFEKLGGPLGVISDVLHTVGNALMQVGNTIGAQVQPILRQLSRTLHEQLLPAWKGIQQGIAIVMPYLEFLGAFIGGVIVVNIGIFIGVLMGVITALGKVIQGVIQFVGGFIQLLSGVFQVTASIIGGAFNIIVDIFTGNWAKIGTDAIAAWNGIKAGIGNIIGGLVSMVLGLWTTLIGGVTGLVSGFISGIIGFFMNLWKKLVGHSIIPDMINSIIGWFASLPGKALGAVGALLGNILGFFSNLASQALGKVSGFIGNVVGFFAGLPGKVMGAIGGLAGQIGGFFSNMAGNAVQWGKNLIGGLTSGIQGMAGAAGNAVGGVANSIKNFLGFGSPTKEGPGRTADQWMPNLGAMLEAGLHEQARRVRTAARGVASAMAEGIQSTDVQMRHFQPQVGGLSPSAASGGTLNGGGMQEGNLHALLAKLVSQQQQQQPLPPLGSQPNSATLGALTQHFGDLHFNVSDVNTLYQVMTELAGLAQENAQRGATTGLGL